MRHTNSRLGPYKGAFTDLAGEINVRRKKKEKKHTTVTIQFQSCSVCG